MVFHTSARRHKRLFAGLLVFLSLISSFAQEKSVNPGINKSFQNPSVEKFTERFEKEGREVYDKREKIVEALKIKSGMTVADVGAGTGLFSRLIAPKVGKDGKLYSVDIAKSFVMKKNSRALDADDLELKSAS